MEGREKGERESKETKEKERDRKWNLSNRTLQSTTSIFNLFIVCLSIQS